MKRRDTITALLLLLLTAVGLVLVAASFLGGEGKLETLLKTTVRERDPMVLLEGAESDEERALVERAVRFGLAALEGGEDAAL